jgi:hypothetical protein
MITFGEFEKTGKEGAVAYLKVLFQQDHVRWRTLILMVLILQALLPQVNCTAV